MTIESATLSNKYSGNGVASLFPYTFQCDQSADYIKVYLINPAGTATLLTSGYLVDLGNHIVQYPADPDADPLPSNWQIEIKRVLPFNQQMDFAANQSFYPEVLEAAFDRLVALLQQMKADVDKALKSPDDWTMEQDLLTYLANNLTAAIQAATTATTQAAIATAAAEDMTELAAMIVDTPTPYKVLKLDGNSKLPADITGSAAKLANVRTFSFIGDATGTLTFDGSANPTANITVPSKPRAIIVDKKTVGTAGGTFTMTGWRTRDLNTILTDSGSIVSSLANNQFTLPPGTYDIKCKAPAYYVGLHACRLRNITAGTTAAVGTTENTSTNSNSVQTSSYIDTRITIAVSTTFELQHYAKSRSQSTTGLGSPANIDQDEVYSVVDITKI